MYISQLTLWNFRKYGSENFDLTKPDLIVPFHNGLNVLIGENNSGKTAIVDAIKLVLKTHSYEWIKVEKEDFHNDETKLRIELLIKGLEENEAKNFIEWLGWDGEKENAKPILRLIYQVERNEDRILPAEVKAGMDETGHQLTAEAKDYLKTTYLKALRDAKSDLIEKKNSRLSQILKEHKSFKTKKTDKKHEFVEEFVKVNSFIADWFKNVEKSNIKTTIDNFLERFINDLHKSNFSLGDPEITNILEKISLAILDKNNPGLGTLNRLYMAAELLHLKREKWDGLRLCLVEELEAHLHPQAQLKIIKALQSEVKTSGSGKPVQIILTTHSPNLASQVKLHNLILCYKNDVYPLGEEPVKDKPKKVDYYTKLDKHDYKYLERFLDVTKANLFFANGIILVEGWSEEILIPIIADKLKIDLTAKQVSIVNVGSTAYMRFAKIFLRNDGKRLEIPVAIITDLDNRPEKSNNQFDSTKKGEKLLKFKELESAFPESSIIVERPENWTLEWSLYKSELLSPFFKKAVTMVHSRTEEFKEGVFEVNKFISMLRKDEGHTKIDKVEVAAHLADLIAESEITKEQIEKDTEIAYLVKAIKHAFQ